MRRATLGLSFVPMFMGSAYKNRGVQLLLDGVREFLPCPIDVSNTALVRMRLAPVCPCLCSSAHPLVSWQLLKERSKACWSRTV